MTHDEHCEKVRHRLFVRAAACREQLFSAETPEDEDEALDKYFKYVEGWLARYVKPDPDKPRRKNAVEIGCGVLFVGLDESAHEHLRRKLKAVAPGKNKGNKKAAAADTKVLRKNAKRDRYEQRRDARKDANACRSSHGIFADRHALREVAGPG